MQLKTGVKIRGIAPELLLGLFIADRIYKEKFQTEMVVTSVIDGVHMQGSKHYLGQGADLRIWGLEAKVKVVVNELKLALDENFDIVEEGDHIHLEYDPH